MVLKISKPALEINEKIQEKIPQQLLKYAPIIPIVSDVFMTIMR